MRFINWFKKESTPEPEPKPETEMVTNAKPNDLVNIEFNMQEDMAINTLIGWNYEAQGEDFAFALGTMLKFLTNGGYDIIIINSMTEAMMSDKNIKPEFVAQVVSTWKGDEHEDFMKSIEDMPVVNPLRTFGESSLG